MISSKRNAVVLVILIFILGNGSGLLLDRLLFHRNKVQREYSHQKRSQWRQKLLDHFTKELDLTPEQQEELRLILDESREQMIQVRERIRSDFEDLRNSTNERIRSILDQKQIEGFDKMIEGFERRHPWRGKRPHRED